MPETPLHFFTIVLNGEPFIRYHIEAFRRLKRSWHWHVVEGAAKLVNDTAWGAQRGGSLPAWAHRQGLSSDGTTEYLDSLAREFPGQVTIYRPPPGAFWEGKVAMVRAPLPNLPAACLLWQIDADELWRPDQIEATVKLFEAEPARQAAYFRCHYFIGWRLCTSQPDVFGNDSRREWLRVWRFQRGDDWAAHEPPILQRKLPDGQTVDLAQLQPFRQEEMARHGLLFQHFAYTTDAQAHFKEEYYGLADARAGLRHFLTLTKRPLRLRRYFPWVREIEIGRAHTFRTLFRTIFEPWVPACTVDDCSRQGVTPLAQLEPDGRVRFNL